MGNWSRSLIAVVILSACTPAWNNRTTEYPQTEQQEEVEPYFLNEEEPEEESEEEPLSEREQERGVSDEGLAFAIVAGGISLFLAGLFTAVGR